MWLRFAKFHITAQGLGLPGGVFPRTFNLSEEFGGPRWWPYEYDGNFDEMIRSQYRYHPQYIPVGEGPRGIGDDYALVAEISLEELLGEDIKNINLYLIPERMEDCSLAIYNKKGKKFRIINVSDEEKNVLNEIIKEIKNWKFLAILDKKREKIQIYGDKKIGKSDEDTKGIFDLNGSPSAGGIGFFWRDGPQPTPSNNLGTGDLSDNLWDSFRKTEIRK
jgi:hypothetical protein